MIKIISIKELKKEKVNNILIPREIETKVKKIISDIRKNQDKALFKYAYSFDKTDFTKEKIKVSQNEIVRGYKRVLKTDKNFIKSINKSISRIRKFHRLQKEKNFFISETGEKLGQLVTPIEKVLIYIPGGKALYPSTLIMNTVPAQIAGVKNIFVTTPVKNNGQVDDKILATAFLLGIENIYKIGGAQAIAAFAFGTESIPQVYKITGPGNIFVAAAKKFVYGKVDIDMIAGPTEVLIITDETVNPYNIAIDMLSQAEHDEMATSTLICLTKKFALKVNDNIKKLLSEYKNNIAEKSIRRNGKIIIVNKIDKAFELANQIAPEHLELMIKQPVKHLSKVKNAGAVFLGEYSPEAAGDYIAGPNHTLPTMGSAKFYSQLGVYDFVKRTGVVYLSKEKFNSLKKDISTIAESERLLFHSLSAKLRI